MSEPARTVAVLIVGGGATGVILAAHLLKSTHPGLRVTLIEKGDAFGQGLAYGTTDPGHLLNVRAGNMSAYADDRDHFIRWLEQRGHMPAGPLHFATRTRYRDYLGDVLHRLGETDPQRLRLLHEEVVDIRPSASGSEVVLANGSSLVGHTVVLASGHQAGASSDTGTASSPEGRVLIVGTGLSMVDAFLSLEAAGHEGEVIALSRRGLLPKPHTVSRPIRLDSADIPLGTNVSYFLRWFRELIASTTAKGGDWRDVMDGLRPFNQAIWQSLPAASRKRFLEHAKPWWDIHRHRMAPHIFERIMAALDEDRLRLLAGRIENMAPGPHGGRSVVVRLRHTAETVTVEAERVIDCTGLVKNPSDARSGLTANLIRRGMARSDPLGLGLDVTVDCAVVDANGRAHSALFAAGPLTRGTFFEIESIPEIRDQCARLAVRLTGGRSASQ